MPKTYSGDPEIEEAVRKIARQRRMARPPMPDGRELRTIRTRNRIVDAMLDLICEGDLAPTAKRISERAQVSDRSLFQHFPDLEALLAAAADRQVERVGHLLAPQPAQGTLQERLDAFTQRRAEGYETIAPVRRAGRLQEPFSPAIATRLTLAREAGRRDVAETFAAELSKRPKADRDELLAALDAASSWNAWESLRTHNALTPEAAARAMRRTLTALLTQPTKKEGASWNI